MGKSKRKKDRKKMQKESKKKEKNERKKKMKQFNYWKIKCWKSAELFSTFFFENVLNNSALFKLNCPFFSTFSALFQYFFSIFRRHSAPFQHIFSTFSALRQIIFRGVHALPFKWGKGDLGVDYLFLFFYNEHFFIVCNFSILGF